MYGKCIEWQASTVIIKYAVDKGVRVNITAPYWFINKLNTNTYYKILLSVCMYINDK